ncbi:MAG TPA: hypothetical protein VGB83_01510 [Actinomycetota bacterium]
MTELVVWVLASLVLAWLLVRQAPAGGAHRAERRPTPPEHRPLTTTTDIGVAPAEIGVAPETAPPGPEWVRVGDPFLQPDPDRLIQSAIVEPSGPAQRMVATLRLVVMIALAGAAFAGLLIGGVRFLVSRF